MTRQDLRTLFNSRPYFYNSGTMYNLADHHYLTNYTFTRPNQISSIDDQWVITFYSYRDLESCIPWFKRRLMTKKQAQERYPEYFI